MSDSPDAMRLCVIGDPITHSLSPAMQRAALAYLGVIAHYDPVRVAAEALDDFFAEVRAGSYSGLNVTLPHKARALALCDEVDLRARAIGAVNTIVRDASGALHGTNTDADGFLDDLRAHLGANLGDGAPTPLHALVLGAGGAARAIVFALRSIDARVVVAARRRGEADVLAQQNKVQSCDFAELGRSLAVLNPFDLVVQTTPCGMSGGPDGAFIAALLDGVRFTADATAYDLIYRPRVTPFLSRARTLGLRTIDGVGMLAGQGARALGHFLDRPVGDDVRAVMVRALDAALAR